MGGGQMLPSNHGAYPTLSTSCEEEPSERARERYRKNLVRPNSQTPTGRVEDTNRSWAAAAAVAAAWDPSELPRCAHAYTEKLRVCVCVRIDTYHFSIGLQLCGGVGRVHVLPLTFRPHSHAKYKRKRKDERHLSQLTSKGGRRSRWNTETGSEKRYGRKETHKYIYINQQGRLTFLFWTSFQMKEGKE